MTSCFGRKSFFDGSKCGLANEKKVNPIKRVAVLTAILDDPKAIQESFNRIVADYQGMVIGRMGIPLNDKGISVICISLYGPMDQINSLNGQLGKLKDVHSKLTISKKKFAEEDGKKNEK